MKCGAYNIYKPSGKKGKLRKEYCITDFHLKVENWPKVQPDKYDITNIEPCDGDIIVSTDRIYDYGDCACSSGTLEFRYKCNKCGNQYFPQLPKDEDSVVPILQKMVDSLPNEELNKMYEPLIKFKKQEREWYEKTQMEQKRKK